MKNSEKTVQRSFLFVYLGLTITTIAFASVRAVLDRSSPPGKPNIEDIWKDGCKLNYLEPESDGGARIVFYDIESKYLGDGRWIGRGTSPNRRHEVNNMREGSEARFRVIASNKVGKSDPSKESGDVKFENPL